MTCQQCGGPIVRRLLASKRRYCNSGCQARARYARVAARQGRISQQSKSLRRQPFELKQAHARKEQKRKMDAAECVAIERAFLAANVRQQWERRVSQ